MGRPRKLRRKGANEQPTSTRNGLTHTCSRCFGTGHNVKSCKNTPHPNSRFHTNIGRGAPRGRRRMFNPTRAVAAARGRSRARGASFSAARGTRSPVSAARGRGAPGSAARGRGTPVSAARGRGTPSSVGSSAAIGRGTTNSARGRGDSAIPSSIGRSAATPASIGRSSTSQTIRGTTVNPSSIGRASASQPVLGRSTPIQAASTMHNSASQPPFVPPSNRSTQAGPSANPKRKWNKKTTEAQAFQNAQGRAKERRNQVPWKP